MFSCSGAEVNASEHPRLALGSHVAAELRDAVHNKLGLTGCAGVATNKLLAKLVSGTFKPNQQTVLLRENIDDIMSSLNGLRKVPGTQADESAISILIYRWKQFEQNNKMLFASNHPWFVLLLLF